MIECPYCNTDYRGDLIGKAVLISHLSEAHRMPKKDVVGTMLCVEARIDAAKRIGVEQLPPNWQTKAEDWWSRTHPDAKQPEDMNIAEKVKIINAYSNAVIASNGALETKANEYSIQEEYDLQDEDGKWEMLSKADVPSFISSDYARMDYSFLPSDIVAKLHAAFGKDIDGGTGFGESKAIERDFYGSNKEISDQGDDIQAEAEFGKKYSELSDSEKGYIEYIKNEFGAVKSYAEWSKEGSSESKATENICPTCKGSGVVGALDDECPDCYGTGYDDTWDGESRASETYYVEWANGGFFETEDMDEAKDKAKDNDGKVILVIDGMEDEQVYPAEEGIHSDDGKLFIDTQFGEKEISNIEDGVATTYDGGVFVLNERELADIGESHEYDTVKVSCNLCDTEFDITDWTGIDEHKAWHKKKGDVKVSIEAEFAEQDHPRDDDGKFTSGGGGGSSSSSNIAKVPSDKKPDKIESSKDWDGNPDTNPFREMDTKSIIKTIKGGSKNWQDWRVADHIPELSEIEKRNREIPQPEKPEGYNSKEQIFRDDPDAIPKMEAKVKYLENIADYWKKVTKFPMRDFRNQVGMRTLGDAKWFAMSNNSQLLNGARKKLEQIKNQGNLTRNTTYKTDSSGKSKPRFYYTEEPKEKTDGESLASEYEFENDKGRDLDKLREEFNAIKDEAISGLARDVMEDQKFTLDADTNIDLQDSNKGGFPWQEGGERLGQGQDLGQGADLGYKGESEGEDEPEYLEPEETEEPKIFNSQDLIDKSLLLDSNESNSFGNYQDPAIKDFTSKDLLSEYDAALQKAEPFYVNQDIRLEKEKKKGDEL